MKIYGIILLLAFAASMVIGCSKADKHDLENGRSQRGYVLKIGEGEVLYDGDVIIKGSPKTGSQGSEIFWGNYQPGFSTGKHVHHVVDEFFYVISRKGEALVGGDEMPIEAGDVVFVPKGRDHELQATGETPLELVFLVDRPGLANEFREADELSNGGKVPMTLEQLNQISEKYGTTYETLD